MSFVGTDIWTILSPIEQSINRKIEAIGTPLREWDISINRGILTGFNEAFIISKEIKDEIISADPKSAEIIRPILRGRDIKRYGYKFADRWLISTFPSMKYWLFSLHSDTHSRFIPTVGSRLIRAVGTRLDQPVKPLSKWVKLF